MNTIEEVTNYWSNVESKHKFIVEEFTKKVNNTPILKELRDWVEINIFGFGERCFYWMWKLLIDATNNNFSFLEIGVFRGQTLSLVGLLAKENNLNCIITGITPLDSTDGHWESDYAKDIEIIHNKFNLPQPNIIKGLSIDIEVLNQVKDKEFDIIYIDGGHTYEVVKADLNNYVKLVKLNGYLVIDDSCNNFKMPWGYFCGIESVTKATEEYFATNKDFKFLFNVMHNRVYKRVK